MRSIYDIFHDNRLLILCLTLITTIMIAVMIQDVHAEENYTNSSELYHVVIHDMPEPESDSTQYENIHEFDLDLSKYCIFIRRDMGRNYGTFIGYDDDGNRFIDYFRNDIFLNYRYTWAYSSTWYSTDITKTNTFLPYPYCFDMNCYYIRYLDSYYYIYFGDCIKSNYICKFSSVDEAYKKCIELNTYLLNPKEYEYPYPNLSSSSLLANGTFQCVFNYNPEGLAPNLMKMSKDIFVKFFDDDNIYQLKQFDDFGVVYDRDNYCVTGQFKMYDLFKALQNEYDIGFDLNASSGAETARWIHKTNYIVFGAQYFYKEGSLNSPEQWKDNLKSSKKAYFRYDVNKMSVEEQTEDSDVNTDDIKDLLYDNERETSSSNNTVVVKPTTSSGNSSGGGSANLPTERPSWEPPKETIEIDETVDFNSVINLFQGFMGTVQTFANFLGAILSGIFGNWVSYLVLGFIAVAILLRVFGR